MKSEEKKFDRQYAKNGMEMKKRVQPTYLNPLKING
jgi:hypothetical protein